jgi:hypothetical protein
VKAFECVPARPACLPVLPALGVRALQVEGLGIGSVASLFTDFGYQRRDRLVFPNKKLQVWLPCL